MGDFNYKGIDWSNNCSDNSSVDSRLFLECINKCFVTQHVMDFTTDNSLLDLIFSRDPDMLIICRLMVIFILVITSYLATI